ncbi:Threonine dehydrogenase [Hoeflea phototrophica DFL-43]|jgi:L-idonate 5-dehydrogenase|uniref:Threonine dehydrogenase n=1 Tax=Hoeflea phototrophica (strain DSM 17068 / NCIMB 14078 / DFL-43) TaxID=411684 RepID=A9DD05_HOEPD|nr:L-idonate 5-dehydrogenase [Hoeflea phototrophica]EDQ32245.1 Threonine dehydrogenase [Hoeflea phototrophica DFL-43]
MKAIVAHAAKDLRIEDREIPTPGPGQVLIRMQTGGICGSDLHYYHNGGFGTVRLKEPMILGHEVSGIVETLGEGVTGLQTGHLVAVSPSRPCQACDYCHEGKQNHCLNMRFYGSAMPFPHIQGAFQQWLVADAAQCAIADGLTAGEAAMAEPLSVVLHAAGQAGDLLGKRVLVTGCGPIGLLAIIVARAAGAAQIVATDITDYTIGVARQVGADIVHNVAETPSSLQDYAAGKGHFDVLFECTGVAPVVASTIPALRPGATMIQLGLGGDMTLPVQAMTAKELTFKGSFRFHNEFFAAINLMRNGRLNVRPLITHTLPLESSIEAFDLASDRTQALKVQLDFA